MYIIHCTWGQSSVSWSRNPAVLSRSVTCGSRWWPLGIFLLPPDIFLSVAGWDPGPMPDLSLGSRSRAFDVVLVRSS